MTIQAHILGLLCSVAIAAVGPALDLNFLTATIATGGAPDADNGTTALTYTGASDKWQWNADGLLERAATNSFLESDDINQASPYWAISASTTSVTAQSDPDGGTKATKIYRSSGTGVAQIGTDINDLAISCTAGLAYKVSLTAKAAGKDYAFLQLNEAYAATHAGYVAIDLKATPTTTRLGSQQTLTGSGIDIIQARAVDLGDGWYRIHFEFTARINNALHVYFGPCESLTSRDSTASATDGVLFYAPQAQPHPSSDDYLETTSTTKVWGSRAGTNNRKPVTNYVLYNQQIDTSFGFGTINSTLSSGQTDPFGGLGATKLIANTASSLDHSVNRDSIPNYYAGLKTFSVFAKKIDHDYVEIILASTTAYTAFTAVTFNIVTGTYVSSRGGGVYGATPVDYGIVAVAGSAGWYRVWVTVDCSVVNLTHRVVCKGFPTSDPLAAWVGDNSSGTLFFGMMANEGGIEDYVGARNLLSNDKAFGSYTDAGADVTADAAVAPDGTTTADNLIEDTTTSNHSRIVQPSVTSGVVHTVSVFAKTNVRRRFTFYEATATLAEVTFDTTSGTVIGTAGGGSPSGTLTYWGNGWYRCTMTFTPTTTGVVNIHVAVARDADTGYTSYTGDGTSGIYVWGAQVTPGSSLYPYVGMPQTGFVRAGYLAEAAATNLLAIGSEGFTTWGATATGNFVAGVQTANQDLGLDGVLQADLIGDNNTGFLQRIDTKTNLTFTGTNDHVASVWVKMDTSRYVGIQTTNETWLSTLTVDLLTGQWVTSSSGGATFNGGGAIPCGGGWYRIWLSMKGNSDSGVKKVKIFPAIAGTLTTAADVASTGNVLVWGFQFETGTYPSSYIKTITGTVSRSADVLSDDTFTTQNASAGCVVAEFNADHKTANSYFWTYEGTTDNALWQSGTTPDLQVIGGANSLSLAATWLPRRGKVAYSYQSADFKASLQGATAVTGSTLSLPSSGNDLDIMHSAGSSNTNGYMRSLQYYNTYQSDVATLSLITDDGTGWIDEKLAA